MKSILEPGSPTRWTLITCSTRDCVSQFVCDFQIDVMSARMARVNPLRRAMAWDGWAQIGSQHVCPSCFEKRRKEPGLSRDTLSATLERDALRKIEVG
jgi:hypothetical protein